MKFSRVKKNKIIQSFKVGGLGIIISIILNLIFNQHEVLLETTILGFVIGTLFGLFEYFISQPKLKRYKFPFVLLINSTVYAWIILVSVGILAAIKMSVVHECTIIEAIGNRNILEYLVESKMHLLLIFLIALSFFVNIFFRVSKLLGPGVLWNLMVGRYHKPTPEERIFLFLDINSSTSIAEKMGTKKYSELLQDFFSHLSEPLLKTNGRIFQYVGDEVVIVWKSKEGFTNNNALKFFFYFEECIQKNKQMYLNKYGLVPSFKAGFHFGETIITEVGDLKKEIVYHGDLVNTTSRIRSACKPNNRKVLVSEEFLLNMFHINEFLLEDIGQVKLNGKKEKLNLYSVEPKPNYLSQLC